MSSQEIYDFAYEDVAKVLEMLRLPITSTIYRCTGMYK